MVELDVYEETLFKVAETLKNYGLDEQQVIDCISDMQNKGIYFRELKKYTVK